MDLTWQIYRLLHDYVEDLRSLEELEDWLVPRLDMFLLLPPGSAARELMAAVELGRDELSSGQVTEPELKRSLKELLSQHTVTQVYLTDRLVWTGSSSVTQQPTGEPYHLYEQVTA